MMVLRTVSRTRAGGLSPALCEYDERAGPFGHWRKVYYSTGNDRVASSVPAAGRHLGKLNEENVYWPFVRGFQIASRVSSDRLKRFQITRLRGINS